MEIQKFFGRDKSQKTFKAKHIKSDDNLFFNENTFKQMQTSQT